MVSPTNKPSSMIICEGDSTFSFLIANTTGNTMTGAVLQLDLPSSCQYIAGSINGATELDISNLNQPTFALPDIINNNAHNVDYNSEITCGYDNTEDFNYNVAYNNSNYSGSDSPLQNYYYPSIVITNITNSSATVQVNQSVTRNFTIEQQGLNASTDTLIILDEHTADIEVLSVSMGTLILDPGPGPIFVDTIIITGSDLPGGNNLFDYGESVILSETVKLVGCNDGQSTINATWGCYGNYCSSYYAFPSVSPASGVPLIDIAFTGNHQGWGFIDNSGFIEFTVTNNGSGSGIAFNLVNLAGFSSGGSVYFPNNDWLNEIDSFSVNGNFVAANYNYASGAPQGEFAYFFKYHFDFDPDGPGIGIEDEDGDGFYDDLPPGNTVTVKAHTYYDWQEAQTKIATQHSCGWGWTNNAWQGFRFGYDFTDQCANQPGATWVPNTNLTLFMTYNTVTQQHTIPPDIYEGTMVWMEQQVVTDTRVEDEGCPNDSVIYHVVLPDGVSLGTPTATFKDVSMGTPYLTGDTVIYFLNKDRVKSGGWFRVPLKINCAVQHNPTATIQTKLKFWCDKTNFPSRFFTYWCSESPVFGIQCPPGNCTDPYISQFSVKRTTMGWRNNQLSMRVNPLDPNIRLDHAMALDSIQIETTGILNGTTDSLYFKLSHENLPGNWSNHLFFDYLSDTLYFRDFETGNWDTCYNLNPVISNGNNSTLELDIVNLTKPGNCLEGYSFTTGDSIRYVICGQIRNITRANWVTVPALRARFYNVNIGTDHYCNDRGITFDILGSNYSYQAYTDVNPVTIEGCDDFRFYGQISRWLDICGGQIGFPNEVRPFAVLDSMTFLIPEGYVYHPGSALHQFYDSDGLFVSETISDPTIEYNANETRLIFLRESNWSYPTYYDCSKNVDRIQFTATPSCQTSSTVTYEILTKGRYQFYVDGIGINQLGDGTREKNYTPSDVVLTPLITTAEGRLDTVSWEIRLCNATDIDANNNWLAFESESEGIEILELIDVTAPATPIIIPIMAYGQGKSWGQLGTLGGDSCSFYVVKAVYSSCDYDSLLVRHSFNCAGYPINPELGYPPTAYSCDENNTYLFLDPRDVSLNLSVSSPANPVYLCDTLTYEVEVTNNLLSYGYNLFLTVTVPPGVSFLPSTSSFKYPYVAGTYLPINDPVNFPAGSNKWVYDISADPNAVTLLKGIDSLPKNGYQLSFKIITDCNLISGSSLNIKASASNACGDVKSRSAFTSPVLIEGLPTNTNLYVLSTQNDPYLPTCNGNSTIKIKAINLGPNSVSDIELLSTSIDDAYDYVPGSLLGIHNGPSGLSNNIVIGGVRYLQFAIQPNLNVNDSIVFTFDLTDIDPGSLECDTIAMNTSAMMVASVSCNNAPGGSCEIQSITSSLITNLTVRKDNVEFGSHFAGSSPNGTTAELVNITYSIKNSGEHAFASDSLGVVFVHDANGNGLADESGADSLYFQRIGVANLLPGDSVVSTALFSVPSDKVCSMLGAIRLSEDSCICSETILTINDIHLANAGSDTMVCINQSIQLGYDSIDGQSYIWIPSNYLSSSTISNPAFLFTNSLSQPDTLTYVLITTRPGGCISRDTCEIIVYPHASANAGSDEHICESLPFDFLNSTIIPTASNHDSLTWFGGTGTFDNPDMLFPVYTPGSGEVGPVELFLVAFSNLNCSQDTSSMILTIDTLPDPAIYYVPNSSICVNEPITFSGFNNNTTTITNWLWHFGDGNTATEQITTYAYTQAGIFNVKLIVSNSNGCVDSIVDNVIVNELPQADFDINPSDTSCAAFPVNLDAISTTNIISWNWDLGDGNLDTGQNISHIYYNPGNFTINLVVENENSCTDTVIDSVFVRQLPIASFSMTPQDTSCPNEIVYFEGLSAENIIFWEWDFGDGATATGQLVNYIYTQPGNYSPRLVFEDINGCTDTVDQNIYVRQPSTAEFLITPSDTSCVDEIIYFTGDSQDNIVSWVWEFGDGNGTSGQSVNHTYAQEGTYSILLIFTNNMGCTDTVVHQKIVDNPNINFSIIQNPNCLNSQVSFISTGDQVTYAYYLWDFGDGSGTASGYTANYQYSQPGNYNISLDVCSKTIQHNLTINPQCIVYAGSDEATCEDVPFDLATAASPPSASGYTAIYWYSDSGQGSFDNANDVTPVYIPDPDAGSTQKDTVYLYMVGYGMAPCENDTSHMMLIIVPGAAAVAGSDENTCINTPFDFSTATDTAFGANYDTLYWSGGSGYFVNPYMHQPVYVPGQGELGPIVLTLVASSTIVNCDSIDEMVLTIRPDYAIPFDTTVCFYDSVFAQGAWRYTSGTYYDTLLSQYGCDSVIITNLTVRPKIDKDFTIDVGDSICLGEAALFTQTGVASLSSWLWDFGDGNTSTDVNPIYTYPASGVYDVQLSYTDINGCYDSVIHQVQVFGLPTVSLTASDYMACVDANIDFFGSSTSNILSWDWDFGDGNTGTGQNTSHSYASFGNFPVTLSVLDINGCSNAALDTITVVEATDVDFSWTFSCDTVTFSDLSIPPPGYYIVQWHWDFGDGTIVTDTTWNQPQHIYGTGGLFDVTLTVVAQSGNMQCDNSITIPVNVPYDPTIYLIWYPQPTCLGDSTQFLGTSGNPISSWFWDFGDGNNSTLQGPSHLYDAIGDYEVTLYILDTTGCSSQLSDSVNIVDMPTASFSMANDYGCINVPVLFNGTSNAGQPSWLWDFGDGNFSTLQNPVHAYTSAGNFFISLTVTDTTACSFTTLEQMITINLAPEADFVATQLVCNSFAFVYTGDNGQAPTSFFWDFDDGGTSTLEDPTHAFPAGGLYNVKLVVSAAVSGQPSCADSITIGVVVPDGPNVGFNWNPEPTNYGDVTDFFGTSSKPIATWAWDFDDSGANSNLQYPSHTFSVPGIFDVLLTATDNEGCVGSSLHQVTVVDNPDVDFTFSPDPGCIDDEITFTGISAASIVSWDWDFGDGYILIGGNQIQGHTYNATGIYTVTLTVTDIYTGVNSVSKIVQVKPLPVANFSYEQPLCALFEVQFHDNSQTPVGYLTEWLWDFGDGNTTTVSYPNNPDVQHAYALPGTYDVTLVVMNSDSCIDDVVNQIVIIPSPTAAFSFSEGCLGQAIAFTDQSVTNGGNIISWNWNFGDPNSGSSNTSTANNPSHVFSASGDFDVTLIIADINGCGDTLIQTITIADPPGVDFSFTTACLGSSTQFTVDQTVTNVGEVQTFAWDFGDGNNSSSQDPEHTYAVLGTYQVTLTITTTAGCVNSITHAVQINPLPNANFEHDGPKCLGEPIAFTNLSSSPNGAIDTWVWDFGDGNTITITAPDNPNVEHTYANDVTYDVSLTVTDVEGCEQTVIKQVQVVASPIANFTFDETCFNEPVFFTDLSSTNGGADLGSWEWFFGDPNSGTNNNSTLQNPTHVFSEPGTFTVTLIVNSTLGCSDTIAQDVLVDPLPEVDFTMASDTICLGELAVFTGIGTDINTWFWQFGDGGTSIEQNPTYMYAEPGNYMVLLTITGFDGCQNSVSHPIFINNIPVADYVYDGSCLGDSTLFTDISVSVYGDIVAWDWNFGDGTTSNLENPNHLFDVNSNYQVTLAVTDNFGCINSIEHTVSIFTIPTAAFNFEQACEPPGIVYFFDESNPGEEGNPLIDYRWNLYNGYYSTEVNPYYVFPQTDTCYQVSLTVTDDKGCQGSDTMDVCLFGTLSVDFLSDTVCVGQPTLFTASYMPVSDSVAAYTWNFNDGNDPFVTYYDTITHVFPSAGMYMVELSTLDTNGCSYTIFKEVIVDSLPTPQFTYSAASCDEPTLFTDTSLGGGEFIEFWLWDFGDIASGADNFSTLQHPSHVFAAQDSVYFVKLIVTNFNGCTDSVVQEVNTNPCLTAYFGFCNGLKCARYEVCFTDSSELISNNGNIIEWSWNFGDGNTLTYNAYQNKVCHIYETTGIFPIQLVITAKVNGQLFYDTATSYFTSYPSPETFFETDSVCFNDTTFFTDVSRDNGEPISSWKWDFGQSGLADTSDLQNPDWLYPETGLYEVQLITINDYGCSDTTQQNVRIYELPQAGFSFEENCASYLTYFNSSESVVEGDGTISSWQWYFGDPHSVDSVAFRQDVTHIYNEAGTYSVRLIVQDENTCLDTVSANVEIFEIPTAGYILTDDFEGRQGNISLENISVGAQQYYWDFDNGDFSDEMNVVYQYREDGNYVIMLVAYNEFNCPDTTTVLYDLLFTNLFVPNAFAPGGKDESLRTFKPVGTNLKEYKIEVFSPWGNKVFSSKKLIDGAPAESWDGKFEGHEMSTGVYIWTISARFKDDTYWKGSDIGDGNVDTRGTVTLIR